MLINGATGAGALGGPNTGGAGGTVVVVSGDVSGDSTDRNGSTVILVDGSVSSVLMPLSMVVLAWNLIAQYVVLNLVAVVLARLVCSCLH